MQPAAKDVPTEQGLTAAPAWTAQPEIAAHQSRNMALLALHQTIFRAGWIFKTESVIMPAFLDWLVGPGAGMLRGLLPVLNRFGQSVPPVFWAGRLKAARYKKLALGGFTFLMSLPFALLAITCLLGQHQAGWVVMIFLGLYGLFFVFNGLYHVSFGTVQGKLIQPTRRGRLLLISTFWGSIPAMLLAWWLLAGWLASPLGGFPLIFGFTACCFFLSAMLTLLIHEPPSEQTPTVRSRQFSHLADTWRVLRRDANLRRLIVVAMLFGCSLIILPHYQAMAREQLGLTGSHLMVWVITQNAAVGIFSLFVGPLADAGGNRMTLRILVFASAVAPLFATWVGYVGSGLGPSLFWLVFVPLGVAPLVLRILVNYTLEICPPVEHPRYLSTLSLCLAMPFVFSPLVGWLVDAMGFAVVFLGAAALVFLGGCLTFTLDEPRFRIAEQEPTIFVGEQ